MTPTAALTGTEPEIRLPTRDEIAERMRAAVSEGRELSSLVRSEVLGVPEDRIVAAETVRLESAPALDTIYSRSRAALPSTVERGQHLSVAGRGGRRAVADLLRPTFVEKEWHGVVEISPAPGDTGLVECVPAGMLCVQFPDSFTSVAMRAYGHEYKLADPQLIQRFRDAARWTLVSLPAAARTSLLRGTVAPFGDEPWPVAAVRDDGKSVVIFLNLFNTPSGQFVRTASNLDNAHALFKIIMEACSPLLTGLWERPVVDPLVEPIRSAVRTFETMRALAAGSVQQIEADRISLERTIQSLTLAIENHRENLMNSLRDQAEAQQRLTVLSSGSAGRLLEGMTEAFRAMSIIENHRGIRSLEFVQVNTQPCMRITTKDFVLNTRERGHNRFCKGVTFEINMETRHAGRVVKFPRPATIPAGQRGVHPHVSGESACWGAAQAALYDAIGRKDWVSAVGFVMGWMLQYNHASPHYSRDTFPTDDRQPGWIDA